VLRTGCQWRQIPHDLVKWWVAYRWFRTLSKDGTWRAIHDELHRAVRAAEGRAGEPTACSMDAQSVQSAEGGFRVGADHGRTGIVIRAGTTIVGTVDLVITDGRVTRIAMQVNPDKLPGTA
jgi:transposase